MREANPTLCIAGGGALLEAVADAGGEVDHADPALLVENPACS